MIKINIPYNALKALSFFVDKDNYRAELCGIHIRSTPKALILEATTGHILFKLEDCTQKISENIDVIICQFSIDYLLKIFSKRSMLTFNFGAKKTTVCSWEFNEQKFPVCLIDAKFPDCEKVIPYGNMTKTCANGFNFNINLLLKFEKAFRILHGNTSLNTNLYFSKNYNDPLILETRFTNIEYDYLATGILMPMNDQYTSRKKWLNIR